MAAFLALGFLIGMQHAFEADHMAAVGALIAGKGRKRDLVLRGAVWGLGHSITLVVIGTAVILTGMQLSEQQGSALEFCVGIMLVLLGLAVLRRFWQGRMHIHVHEHDGSGAHIHAHSHKRGIRPHSHTSDTHHQHHHHGFPIKALTVGLLHGGAGSAALLTLVVAATQSPALAIAYIMLFGIGAMLGMSVLTMAVVWPLSLVERSATWAYQVLGFAAAMFAVYLGVSIMLENASSLGNWL